MARELANNRDKWHGTAVLVGRFTGQKRCCPDEHCRLQNGRAEVVLFQQMMELADRRLVGHGLVAEIDLREAAHHGQVVQRLFHRRVREAESLLQKVNPQHALDAHRTASIAGLGTMRLN